MPITCLLAAVVLCGSEGRNGGLTQRPRDAAAVVRRVTIGRTTAHDVGRQLGVADKHAPDGALVYPLHALLGIPEGDETLRFERGVLSRICWARS